MPERKQTCGIYKKEGRRGSRREERSQLSIRHSVYSYLRLGEDVSSEIEMKVTWVDRKVEVDYGLNPSRGKTLYFSSPPTPTVLLTTHVRVFQSSSNPL